VRAGWLLRLESTIGVVVCAEWLFGRGFPDAALRIANAGPLLVLGQRPAVPFHSHEGRPYLSLVALVRPLVLLTVDANWHFGLVE